MIVFLKTCNSVTCFFPVDVSAFRELGEIPEELKITDLYSLLQTIKKAWLILNNQREEWHLY